MKYQPKTKEELRGLIVDKSIHLGDIDTSLIIDMSLLFYNVEREDFSGIENWSVSQVVYMAGMFLACRNFNHPLNNWDVSNVKSMKCMFCGCIKFNQPLNNWSVYNVKDFSYMFFDCLEYNQPLKWNISSTAIIEEIFGS